MATISTSTNNTPAVTAQSTIGPYYEQSGPYARRWAWLTIVVMALVQTADIVLAKSTFNLVARDAEWISWMIALCVGIGSSFAAFHAGKTRRKQAITSFRITVGLWLAVGLGLAGIRIAEPLLSERDLNPGEVLMAVFILVLYLVAGWKIQETSYETYNPKLMQLASARRAERWLAWRLHRTEGKYTRVHNTLTGMEARKEVLTAEYKAAKDEANAHTAELKDRARLEVASVLQRAEATGVYRQATWPKPGERDAA